MPRRGLAGSISRHPRSWAGVAAAVVLVALGTVAFTVGSATASPGIALSPISTTTPSHASTPAASATHSATPTPTITTPPPRPTPAAVAAAAKLRTCSVAAQAADGRLGTLEAQVVNASTGEVLFDRNGSTPAPTASVMKTITAAAALAALGPNYQIPTKVAIGSRPGQIYLIGGGDPTLSAGNGSFYTNPPTLTQLAAQVKQALASNPATANVPITSIVTDATLFSGPTWLPSWDFNEEHNVEGSTSYITALMVDGDKQNPTALESPRGNDPVADAGKAFASALGVPNAAVTSGATPSGSRVIGTVYSQPVSSLLNEALLNSDNTVMEMLTRLVAIKEGSGNTFSAENAGVLKALQSYGLDTTGLYIVDGSGLSGDNRVPPSFLTQYMIKVLNGASGLGLVYDSLPISGETGTLGPGYDRFEGASSIAVGHVNAKTGWINNAYTLAGIVHAKDGTNLSFAVFALGNVGDSAKAAIDTLVAGFYSCGNNLSNG